MSVKKVIALLMVIVMVAGVVAGCGGAKTESKETAQSSTSSAAPSSAAQESKPLEPVTLKMMLPGAHSPGLDLVLAEAEKRMAGTINVKLELIFASWGEYKQKNQVALNAGEDVDLMFDAPWNNMIEMVSAGYYLPLDDLIKQYGPNLTATRPQVMWDNNRFQGKDGVYKIYGVPLGNSHFNGKSYIIRGDYREKMGMAPVKTHEDYIKYLYGVKENYKDVIPVLPDKKKMTWAEFKLYMDQDSYVRPLVAAVYGPLYLKGNDGLIHNMFDTMEPKFWEGVQEARKLYNDGIIGQDVMATSDYAEQLRAGKTSSIPHFAFGGSIGLNNEILNLPGAKFEDVILIDTNKKFITDFKQWNFQCIPVTSKNKERSIMFLDWANASQDNYDLLSYGIKDYHWQDKGNNTIYYIPDAEKKYDTFPYLWTWNPVQDRMDSLNTPEVNKMELWIKDSNNFIPDITSGFTFNSDPVSAELAQYTNLLTTYFAPISQGVVDPDKTWAEYKEKCAAYTKTIQTEMQKQLDEYIVATGRKK